MDKIRVKAERAEFKRELRAMHFRADNQNASDTRVREGFASYDPARGIAGSPRPEGVGAVGEPSEAFAVVLKRDLQFGDVGWSHSEQSGGRVEDPEEMSAGTADALADVEQDIIRERVVAGLEYAHTNGTRSGKPVGRPRVIFRHDLVFELRNQDMPWRQIAKLCGVGVTTVRRAYQSMKAKHGLPKPGE